MSSPPGDDGENDLSEQEERTSFSRLVGLLVFFGAASLILSQFDAPEILLPVGLVSIVLAAGVWFLRFSLPRLLS